MASKSTLVVEPTTDVAEQSPNIYDETCQQAFRVDLPLRQGLNTNDSVELRGLMVEIKDVLGSFVQELQRMNQHQSSAQYHLSPPAGGKAPAVSNDSGSQQADGNGPKDSTPIRVRLVDVIPDYIPSVTSNQMEELRNSFLRRLCCTPAVILPLNANSQTGPHRFFRFLPGERPKKRGLVAPDLDSIKTEWHVEAPMKVYEEHPANDYIKNDTKTHGGPKGISWSLGDRGWRGWNVIEHTIQDDGRLVVAHTCKWKRGKGHPWSSGLSRIQAGCRGAPIKIW
jgi:hypothetical protein